MKNLVVLITIAFLSCNNNTEGDKVTLPSDAPRPCTQAKLDSFINGYYHCLPSDTLSVEQFIYTNQCSCGR